LRRLLDQESPKWRCSQSKNGRYFERCQRYPGCQLRAYANLQGRVPERIGKGMALNYDRIECHSSCNAVK
jgi:hypothetical protein